MADEENKSINLEQPNSCEISVNAKGLYSGKVKVYAKTIEDAINEAKSRALELEGLIRTKNGL